MRRLRPLLLVPVLLLALIFGAAQNTQAAFTSVTANTGTQLSAAVTYGLFTTPADIGSGAAGPTSSAYNSGTGVYTEVGNGTDINNASDQFHYLYASWTGDGTII